MFTIFGDIIIYAATFVALYVSLLWLIVVWENKENLYKPKLRRRYPSVCIIVPCFNEEKTIVQTIHSLLNLDYPKNKLEIFIVDDGSTDNTYQKAKQLLKHPQVKLFYKENGGKHTALNYGLSKTSAEFIGCLDADSFVSSDALKKMMAYFSDKNIVAATAALKIYKPQNAIQQIQRIEYIVGITLRKIMACLNSITVIPGPFSIYRKNIFEQIGLFVHGHNTEDMEIAFRIQSKNYRITSVTDAYVWTTSPFSLPDLQKQRKRWLQGFIRNLWDYRYLVFNRRHGDLGLFMLPTIIISALLFMIVIPYTVFRLIQEVINNLSAWRFINFDIYITDLNFNWFFINTQTIVVAGLLSFVLIMIFFFVALKIAKEKTPFKKDLLLFIIFYNPLLFAWWLSAIFEVALNKKNKWRAN